MLHLHQSFVVSCNVKRSQIVGRIGSFDNLGQRTNHVANDLSLNLAAVRGGFGNGGLAHYRNMFLLG